MTVEFGGAAWGSMTRMEVSGVVVRAAVIFYLGSLSLRSGQASM
jgi:hypothetical protein